jgi:catechol 2,3-dioxygenase-like lactoylglutathione lyase family enzyme
MEERPPVWVGHIALNVRDVRRAADFWCEVGMREIFRDEQVAIMELRGGTHLVILPGEPEGEGRDAPFDLMVDDLDATHAAWTTRGLDPTPIEANNIHRSFSVVDPDGYRVFVNNSHVEGVV